MSSWARILNEILYRRNVNPYTFRQSFWKMYKRCACLNAVFIGATNIGSGISETIQDTRTVTYPTKYWGRKLWLTLLEYTACLSALGVMTGFKTFMFYLGGPIGTYRIGLGMYNYAVTKDSKWINVLINPGSSVVPANGPYLVRPVGTASWIPIRRVPVHPE